MRSIVVTRLNKKLYTKLQFTKSNVPYIACPSCMGGRLVSSENYVTRNDSASTIRNRKEDDWEPEFSCCHFSAVLVCNDPACSETVHVVGEGRVEEVIVDYDEMYGPIGGLTEVYIPHYFVPPLRIFDCPSRTPERVKRDIEASFSVFFADTSAAGNRIRIAVESLLTALKVPLKEKTKKGEFKRSSLHRRIERLGSKHNDVKVMLLAVKWIGNTGSHGEDLKKMDVLVAYEMLEHCLRTLYNDDSDLMSVAKAINQRKGPLKTRVKLRRRPRSTGS